MDTEEQSGIEENASNENTQEGQANERPQSTAESFARSVDEVGIAARILVGEVLELQMQVEDSDAAEINNFVVEEEPEAVNDDDVSDMEENVDDDSVSGNPVDQIEEGVRDIADLGHEIDAPYLEGDNNDGGERANNDGEAVLLNLQPETWVATPPHLRNALRTLLSQAQRDGQGAAAFLNQNNRMQQLRHILFIANYQNLRRRQQRNNSDSDGADNSQYPLSSDDDMNEAGERSPPQEHDITISFDTNLPAEHSYLGANMDRVSGVNYIEPGQHTRLMLFKHEHILFPGEILPFMLSGSVIESEIDAQNGLLFGVCFPHVRSADQEDKLYGVTCQIYEKGSDAYGKSMFKSRALQRFVTKASYLKGPLQFITHSTIRCYGDAKILPEVYLPEPYKAMNMGSMKRFRDIPTMELTLKRFYAASTPFPQHIYEKFNINTVINKARTVLANQKLEAMPTDPVQLSFWLVRNLHLSETLTYSIFTLDSVNRRMEIIGNSFQNDAVFICKFCGKKIANCSELFAMSKHGVQSQYCNSAGYIHETNTVYSVCRDAIKYSGQPSSEFSWFPGYQWQIIICKLCSHHIGWKYSTDVPSLEPKAFFGITSTSVRITTSYTEPPPRDDFYRLLLRHIIPNNVQ